MIIILLIYFIIGLSISSDSTDVVSICLGGELSLTCIINASFLQWNINIPHYNQGQTSITRLFSTNRVTNIAETFTINETDFGISKTSDRGAVTLVSTLSITNVSVGLNGTLIQCMEVDGTMNPTLKLFSTTINVRRDQFGRLITINYLGDTYKLFFLN